MDAKTDSENQGGGQDPPPSTRAHRAFYERLADWYFGYDYFISYCWADAREYAVHLNNQLEASGFTCFLDSSDYAKGDNWREKGRHALHGTSRLIYVATPESLDSEPVKNELRIFSQLGRRIIPIDLDGTLSACEKAGTLPEYLDPEVLRIPDTRKSRESKPSPEVVEQLRDSFDLTRQVEKRRRWLLATMAAFSVLAVAMTFFALSWVMEQRVSESIALRRDGEHALLKIDQGEIAAGTALLSNVAHRDRRNLLPEYQDLLCFLPPRLEGIDQLFDRARSPEIIRWQYDFYLKSDAETLIPLPTSAPFVAASLDGDEHLVVANYESLSLFELPSLTRTIEWEFGSRVVPQGVYDVHGSDWLLAVGTKLHITNDEDESRFESTLLSVVIPHAKAIAERWHLHGESAPVGSDTVHLSGLVAEDGAAILRVELDRQFSLAHAALQPDEMVLSLGGILDQYDDNPPLSKLYVIDVAALSVEESTPESDENRGLTSQARPSLPVYEFPRQVEESAFWSHPREGEGLEWAYRKEIRRAELDRALTAADFSGFEEEKAARWNDMLMSGFGPFGLHTQPDGTRYMWDMDITGNSFGTVVVCKAVQNSVQWCEELLLRITQGFTEAAPDRSWLAQATESGSERSFNLFDISEAKAVEPTELPINLIHGIAFSPDSSRMAVLTEANIVWVYSLDPRSTPSLTGRFPLASQRMKPSGSSESAKGELIFLGEDIVVAAIGNTKLYGLGTRSGDLLWAKDLVTGTDEAKKVLLVGAETGPYFGVIQGESIRLVHGPTGTPLSEAIDVDDLFSSMIPDFSGNVSPRGLSISDRGDMAISDGGKTLLRRRPMTRANLPAALETIEKRTGIDARDGRAPLPKIPVDWH